MAKHGHQSVLFSDLSGVPLRAPRGSLPVHVEVSPHFMLPESKRESFSRTVASLLSMRKQFDITISDETVPESGMNIVTGSLLYFVHDSLLRPIIQIDPSLTKYDHDAFQPCIDARSAPFITNVLQRITHIGLGQLIDDSWRVSASYEIAVPNYESGARIDK